MSVKQSRNHHWWPVGLQRYWAGSDGKIHIMSPSGEVISKSYKNRKIGRKRNGHIVDFGDSPWSFNFEDAFKDIDESINEVIVNIMRSFPPRGVNFREKVGLIRDAFFGIKHPSRMCKYYQMHPDFKVGILKICASLLVRSPYFRNINELNPTMIGLPRNERIGTLSVNQYAQYVSKINENICGNGFFFISKYYSKQ